ncbi:hypothetical protein ANCCAN_04642 [Ancylostoma caninum]|uniref:Aminopeptidase N-like N-terminal domain-containing protein n=1 Tax=Ancylostoma caninum TaxID=29170 RepID=A0A368H1W2_ANCCA|nr:hypothetical protein ANCCAN_04642 [Ancylostoma caninum]
MLGHSADGYSFIIAAVTQCEPMGARAIVPCFDEPEYKAIWNVTIIHPVGTKAIANALELSETTWVMYLILNTSTTARRDDTAKLL